MKKRNYVERRLYYSETCIKCGKPFKSFKRSRVKGGVCRRQSCRYSVSENQQPLFDDVSVGVGVVQKSNFDPITQVPNDNGRYL